MVTCADDPGARAARRAAARAGAAGSTPTARRADADLRLTDVRLDARSGVRYLASLDGEPLGEIRLPVPGRHLGLNSAAAVLTALRLGLPLRPVAEALAAFPGVRRRFELKGVADGVRVYDEYAYHPTSMTAALQHAARGGRRRPAAGGVPAVPGLPHPRPAGRDRRRRWPSPTRRSCMEVFGPGEVREPGEGGVALTAAIAAAGRRSKVFVAVLGGRAGRGGPAGPARATWWSPWARRRSR